MSCTHLQAARHEFLQPVHPALPPCFAPLQLTHELFAQPPYLHPQFQSHHTLHNPDSSTRYPILSNVDAWAHGPPQLLAIAYAPIELPNRYAAIRRLLSRVDEHPHTQHVIVWVFPRTTHHDMHMFTRRPDTRRLHAFAPGTCPRATTALLARSQPHAVSPSGIHASHVDVYVTVTRPSPEVTAHIDAVCQKLKDLRLGTVDQSAHPSVKFLGPLLHIGARGVPHIDFAKFTGVAICHTLLGRAA